MKNLETTLERLGIAYTPEMIRQYGMYMELVLERNKFINLTAITDPEAFEIKHFADSVVIGAEPEVAAAESVVDVGTGAGFPGIPLAILFPEKRFLLMDSLRKRIAVISEFADAVGLKNVEVMHARAEEAARDPKLRESFSLCVSRAVANLSTLSEYCLPFVKPGGYFFAYKGPGSESELDYAGRAIKILGGKVAGVRDPLPSEFGLSHNIIVIEKVTKTPEKYPRKAGMPSKEPL